MVLLDGEPIRRKAASDCQREMARLEQAKSDWKRYEQEDLPAFGKWMVVTFGARQTEMRELRARIRRMRKSSLNSAIASKNPKPKMRARSVFSWN